MQHPQAILIFNNQFIADHLRLGGHNIQMWVDINSRTVEWLVLNEFSLVAYRL